MKLEILSGGAAQGLVHALRKRSPAAGGPRDSGVMEWAGDGRALTVYAAAARDQSRRIGACRLATQSFAKARSFPAAKPEDQ
jgi:hypothetical protein